MLLKDKTALVSGGSRGIGLAIAKKMAANGANIALNYFAEEKEGREAQKEIQKMGVKCEIYHFNVADFKASKEGIDKIIKDFGKVDILVNNAGITRDGLVATMTEEDFDSVMNINLKGAFNLTKHLYMHFSRNRSGSIVNVASIIGMMGGAGQANYSASKAGMIGLTKSIARELGGRGVTCNAIAPGFIETAMTAVLPEEVKKKYLDMIPLKRFANVEEVADLVFFLATAKYITGEVVKIDGGLYI